MTVEEKEQRIRDLTQELFYGDYGDWQIVRGFESLLDDLGSAKTIIGIATAFKTLATNLKDIITSRVSARAEIERLRKEIKDVETNN